MKFSKYHGAGNDFILIEDSTCSFSLTHLIPLFCDRHKGIGADGLILLQPSKIADLKMVIYNCDGSCPKMCGNGLRCLVLFAQEKGYLKKPSCSIETGAGLFYAEIVGDQVSLRFPKPNILEKVTFEHLQHPLFVIDSGVPHGVVFTQEAKTLCAKTLGKKIRSDPYFAPQGINVNFADFIDETTLFFRTYERGVEGETLACGTGAIATAYAAYLQLKNPRSFQLFTQEGDLLVVSFNDKEIPTLTGAASKIFDGVFSLTAD